MATKLAFTAPKFVIPPPSTPALLRETTALVSVSAPSLLFLMQPLQPRALLPEKVLLAMVTTPKFSIPHRGSLESRQRPHSCL